MVDRFIVQIDLINMKPPLTKEGSNEYRFNPTGENCTVWITVGSKSVYIIYRKDRIEVKIFKYGEEAGDPIDEAFASN